LRWLAELRQIVQPVGVAAVGVGNSKGQREVGPPWLTGFESQASSADLPVPVA